MMKTDGINPLDSGPLKKARPAEKTGQTSSFDKVFKAAISSEEPLKTSAMGNAAPLPEMRLFGLGDSAGSKELLTSIEKTLTDLDMFGSALGNNDISLKRLKPLINELLARKDELAELMEKTTDQSLKSATKDVLSIIIDQANQYETGYAA